MSRKTRGLEPGKGSKPSRATRQARVAVEGVRDVLEVVELHDKQIPELQQYFGMLYDAMGDVVRGSEEMDITIMAMIALLAKKLGVTSEELEHEREHVRKLKAEQRERAIAAYEAEKAAKAQESSDPAPGEPPLPDLLSARQSASSVEYPGAFEFGG